MKKEMFNIVLGLVKKQPWLESKLHELEHILYMDCKNERSLALILEVLDRFFYVNHTKYHSLISDLAYEIATLPNINDDNTQIVAMAADSNADSSQEVIYNLKPIMEELGWRNHIVVNRFSLAFKSFKTHGHKNIILVDDFIGTGKTVLGRIKEIKAQFSTTNITDYKIRVMVLVSTQSGLDNLVANGVEVTSITTIKKGIDDYYDETTAEINRQLMLEVESSLSKEYNGRLMPSLGYGNAQAAYCRENANTPNSVFPVFWWPIAADGSERKKLLVRAMGDA